MLGNIKITANEMNMEFKRWGLLSVAKPKDVDSFYVDVYKNEENCVRIIYEGLINQKTELLKFYLDKVESLN